MSLITTCETFFRDLAKYGIDLRNVKIKGLDKFIEIFKKEAEDNKAACLKRYDSAHYLFLLPDDTGFPIQEDPWIAKYNHDPNMSKEYFLRWRRAFGEIARFFPQDSIGAEVGVYEGFLTDQVLKYLKPKQYHLIDPYRVYDDTFLAKIPQQEWDKLHLLVNQKYKDNPNVFFIRAPSLSAVLDFKDESLDWVYIDGDHTQDAVYKDIVAWFPKIKKGGFLSGHDFMENGVRNSVFGFMVELRGEQQEAVRFQSGDNDWWFHKE